MSDALQVIGCIAATTAAAAAMLAGERRSRSLGLLAALAIAAALLVSEGWDELESVRDNPALLALACIAAGAGLGALAAGLRRWPLAAPLLLVAALPFRIPIEVGGEEANLLLPLYAVIAGAALAYAWDALRDGGRRVGAEPRPLLIALAAVIVLYAIQASYSNDIGFATRNVGFFLVPFAAMFVLLAEVEWSPRTLGLALAVVAGEAALFALVGIGQAAAGEIFWNPALELSNDFHFYVRVNSLFWDPNIYGRYLALAATLVLAVLMWSREPRRIYLLAALLFLILVGLLFGYSQTSFLSLLVGIAVLCGLRWSAKWTAIAIPFAVVTILAALIVIGGSSSSEDDPEEFTSGRTTLVEGGYELAKEEPLIGHGSASFSKSFAEREGLGPNTNSLSHNEPVTVASEQGAIGAIAYLALVAVSFWALLIGMRRIAPGLGAPEDAIGDPAEGGESATRLARIALLAAFAGLFIHTIGYAGYLTDPLTWALLAIGGSLAPRS